MCDGEELQSIDDTLKAINARYSISSLILENEKPMKFRESDTENLTLPVSKTSLLNLQATNNEANDKTSVVGKSYIDDQVSSVNTNRIHDSPLLTNKNNSRMENVTLNDVDVNSNVMIESIGNGERGETTIRPFTNIAEPSTAVKFSSVIRNTSISTFSSITNKSANDINSGTESMNIPALQSLYHGADTAQDTNVPLTDNRHGSKNIEPSEETLASANLSVAVDHSLQSTQPLFTANNSQNYSQMTKYDGSILCLESPSAHNSNNNITDLTTVKVSALI